MGILKSWPECEHQPERWALAEYWVAGETCLVYRSAQCRHCGRPLVTFSPDFDKAPRERRRECKRHAAWRYLDKAYEHAGNAYELPWEPSRG